MLPYPIASASFGCKNAKLGINMALLPTMVSISRRVVPALRSVCWHNNGKDILRAGRRQTDLNGRGARNDEARKPSGAWEVIIMPLQTIPRVSSKM